MFKIKTKKHFKYLCMSRNGPKSAALMLFCKQAVLDKVTCTYTYKDFGSALKYIYAQSTHARLSMRRAFSLFIVRPRQHGYLEEYQQNWCRFVAEPIKL